MRACIRRSPVVMLLLTAAAATDAQVVGTGPTPGPTSGPSVCTVPSHGPQLVVPDPGPLALPPLWYAGDTHGHVQKCGVPADPDFTVPELLALQAERGVTVTACQIWGTWTLDTPAFLGTYVPMVTGVEDPLTAEDPATALQFGVEVSGFPSSQFGHLHALGIADAAFPLDALTLGPVATFFEAQPGAVLGYAHVNWPWAYNVGQIPFNPIWGIAGYTTALDAALGRIAFVETTVVNNVPLVDWRGVYYKLLNAGLRLGFSGGKDPSCTLTDVRTYAKLLADPLTFEGWIDALALGRTCVSDRPRLLELDVGGVELGGELALAEPATVAVTVTLRIPAGEVESGVLRLVAMGEDVVSVPYMAIGPTPKVFGFEVPFEQSAWIAAYADVGPGDGAHTAPVYVVVADEPICSVEDAQYWNDYLGALADNLAAFDTGAEDEAMLIEIAEAQAVFAALAACSDPLPLGALRRGRPSHTRKGPVRIGLSVPDGPGAPPGAPWITCLGAPPRAGGWLLALHGDAALERAPVDALLEGSALVAAARVAANGAGWARQRGTPGAPCAYQFVWDAGEVLATSDVLVLPRRRAAR